MYMHVLIIDDHSSRNDKITYFWAGAQIDVQNNLLHIHRLVCTHHTSIASHLDAPACTSHLEPPANGKISDLLLCNIIR